MPRGAINPIAAPGFTRFYYQGQEFETSQADWDAALARHATSTKSEHDAVIEAGGLHILGTERHESRRVDNQLRGRAGRQGDPGSSRFFLSLEDDLMRIFAREWVGGLLQRLGMEEGVPIESGMISKRIEAAQKAVEAQNFESRKHVLEYDDVMNKQREAVYGLRRQLMEGVDQKGLVTDDYVSTILSNLLDQFVPEKAVPDQWKLDELFVGVQEIFGADFRTGPDAIDAENLSRRELGDALFERLGARYDVKEQILSAPQLRYHERVVMLSVLDGLWKEHLLNMDHLKEGIGLRGYAQQDPLVAYKKESFEMFESLMLRFQEDTARHLFRMQILGPDGRPIETLEQFNSIQSQLGQQAPPQQQLPPAHQQLGFEPTQETLDDLASGGPESDIAANNPVKEMVTPNGNHAPQPPVIPTRAASTTIDALEREFERNKQRDLASARQAGGLLHSHIAGPCPHRRNGRPQRPLSLRLRQKVQEVPRSLETSKPRFKQAQPAKAGLVVSAVAALFRLFLPEAPSPCSFDSTPRNESCNLPCALEIRPPRL